MNCPDVIRNLPLLMYNEATFEQEEALLAHLEQCGDCRQEHVRMREMLGLMDAADSELPPGLLTSCRRSLRVNVASLAEAESTRRGGMAGWLEKTLGFGWSGWAKPATALTLLMVGFTGGRLVQQQPSFIPDRPLTPPAASMDVAGLTPEASRVRFIEPAQDGRVQIVLEETRQRVLQGNAGDANIRRLLMTAARESSDAGLRVDSVDLLATGPETSEVRDVLLYSLQHDPNPGVRLKALDGLRSSAADPEARKVLARVLLTDTNPGVRTQAIDLLIQKKEADVAGVLEQALERDDNNYVRLKCQKALHELKATAESY